MHCTLHCTGTQMVKGLKWQIDYQLFSFDHSACRKSCSPRFIFYSYSIVIRFLSKVNYVRSYFMLLLRSKGFNAFQRGVTVIPWQEDSLLYRLIVFIANCSKSSNIGHKVITCLSVFLFEREKYLIKV